MSAVEIRNTHFIQEEPWNTFLNSPWRLLEYYQNTKGPLGFIIYNSDKLLRRLESDLLRSQNAKTISFEKPLAEDILQETKKLTLILIQQNHLLLAASDEALKVSCNENKTVRTDCFNEVWHCQDSFQPLLADFGLNIELLENVTTCLEGLKLGNNDMIFYGLLKTIYHVLELQKGYGVGMQFIADNAVASLSIPSY